MADPLAFHEAVPSTEWRPAQKPAELGEVMSANFNLARDDTVGVQEHRRNSAIVAIETALYDVTDARYRNPADGETPFHRGKSGVFEDRMFADLARIRASQPDFLKDVPARNRAEFDKWVIDQQKARRAIDKSVVDRGEGFLQGAAGFAAGVAGAMTDPVNLMTLPFGGGGKTIMQVAAREALLNGVIEAALTPAVASNREALGEELTAGEAIANVGMAVVGGAVLGGGIKAIEVGAPRVGAAAGNAYDRTIQAVFDALPENMRARWADAMELPDDALPAVADALIGLDRLTLDEQAAVHVITRQAEIEAVNPFVGSAIASDAHGERLAEAMRAIISDTPPPRPRLAADTALSSGTVRAPVAVEPGLSGNVAAVKALIGRAENASGGLSVRNPNSSATGPYQFTRGTWIRTFKRRFGDEGLSDDEIWAKRTESRELHEQLMDTLTGDNAAALRRAGFADTKGNVYLAHFAGEGGAKAILRAAPDTPIEHILSAEAIAANRSVLEGKTAAEVIVWAHRKMGARGDVPPVAAVASAGDEAAVLRGEADALQAEADRLGEDLARLRGDAPSPEGGASPIARGIADPIDDAPLPAPIDVPEILAPATRAEPDPIEASRPALDRATDRVAEMARDYGQSLNPRELARVLEISEDQARRALALAAARPGSNLHVGRSGAIRRLPQQRGPEDAISFLARRGGIADEIGERGLPRHDLVAGMGLNRFVAGAGPLVRQSGRTVEAAGEILHEAGYFGPPATTARPTEAQVLEFLDRAMSRKAYAVGDIDDAATLQRSAADAEALDEIQSRIDARLHAADMEFDAADMEAAARLVHEGGRDIDDAILEIINRNAEDARLSAAIETDDIAYDAWEGYDADYAGSALTETGNDLERSARSPGDAGEGGAYGAEYPTAREDADWAAGRHDLGDAAYARFDDPDGPGAKAQAESLEHDARALVLVQSVPKLDETNVHNLHLFDKATLERLAKESPLEAMVEEDIMSREAAAQMLREYWDYSSASDENLIDVIRRTLIEQRENDWINRVEEGRGWPDQAVAYVRLKGAYNALADRGYDFSRLGSEIVSKLVERGWSVSDAGEVVGHRVGGLAGQLRGLQREPVDPAIAERLRQELELGTAAPLRSIEDQDGVMGLGLFDAADQPTFRLSDEGDERSLADILREADDDAAAVQAARACMVPPKIGGGS